MKTCECDGNSARLFLGLTFIAAGVVLFLDNYGLTRIESIWSYWPLLLIVLGMTKLLSQPSSQER
jgi:hypothetical protein